MPGLVRGMVRTAAVVGTATATRNAVDRRQAEKNARAYADAQNAYNQEVYHQQPQQYAPPPQQYAPPPPPAEDDMLSQLERLGTLHAQGVLTDEEFAAAKAKLLS